MVVLLQRVWQWVWRCVHFHGHPSHPVEGVALGMEEEAVFGALDNALDMTSHLAAQHPIRLIQHRSRSDRKAIQSMVR